MPTQGHRANAWCNGEFLPQEAIAELKKITKVLKACDPRDKWDWVTSGEGDVRRLILPSTQSVDQSATN
jgi:hypothetical protein